MEALVRWLENCGAENEVKERYAERLYPCIRLNKCTKEKLKEHYKNSRIPNVLKLKMMEYLLHGLQEGSTEARRLHSSAPTAKVPAAATASSLPVKPTTRATTATPADASEERVLLVGGRTTDSKVNENAIFIDKPLKDSILTRPPVCVGADRVSVCAAPGGFIASGGVNATTESSVSRVQMFSLADLSWSDLPDMLHSRESHGTACTNNHFFTAGGCNCENWKEKTRYASVNMLDLETFAWFDCQALQTAVSVPGVTSVDNDVFVFGGYDRKGATTLVCKYDPSTGKRTDCKPMPQKCIPWNCTVAVGRVVFVLAYTPCLFMQYDTTLDQWTEFDLPCPLKKAEYSAMVLHSGRLMVTGGSSEGSVFSPHNLVQSYDIDNKTWCLEKQTTPLPLTNHVAIVVKMPRSK